MAPLLLLYCCMMLKQRNLKQQTSCFALWVRGRLGQICVRLQASEAWLRATSRVQWASFFLKQQLRVMSFSLQIAREGGKGGNALCLLRLQLRTGTSSLLPAVHWSKDVTRSRPTSMSGKLYPFTLTGVRAKSDVIQHGFVILIQVGHEEVWTQIPCTLTGQEKQRTVFSLHNCFVNDPWWYYVNREKSVHTDFTITEVIFFLLQKWET